MSDCLAFLSYCRDDNTIRQHGSAHGPVSALHSKLTNALAGASRLHPGLDGVYMDLAKEAGSDLRTSVITAIKHCAVMIFIMTEASLNSRWCQREVATFFEANPHDALHRLVVIDAWPRVDSRDVRELCPGEGAADLIQLIQDVDWMRWRDLVAADAFGGYVVAQPTGSTDQHSIDNEQRLVKLRQLVAQKVLDLDRSRARLVDLARPLGFVQFAQWGLRERALVPSSVTFRWRNAKGPLTEDPSELSVDPVTETSFIDSQTWLPDSQYRDRLRIKLGVVPAEASSLEGLTTGRPTAFLTGFALPSHNFPSHFDLAQGWWYQHAACAQLFDIHDDWEPSEEEERDRQKAFGRLRRRLEGPGAESAFATCPPTAFNLSLVPISRDGRVPFLPRRLGHNMPISTLGVNESLNWPLTPLPEGSNPRAYSTGDVSLLAWALRSAQEELGFFRPGIVPGEDHQVDDRAMRVRRADGTEFERERFVEDRLHFAWFGMNMTRCNGHLIAFYTSTLEHRDLQLQGSTAPSADEHLWGSCVWRNFRELSNDASVQARARQREIAESVDPIPPRSSRNDAWWDGSLVAAHLLLDAWSELWPSGSGGGA